MEMADYISSDSEGETSGDVINFNFNQKSRDTKENKSKRKPLIHVACRKHF